jgi:hypothetical protein
MKSIGHLAAITCLFAVGACAQLPSASDITTGSILPALPSAASLVPSLTTSTEPRKPERVSGNLYRIDASDRKFDDAIQRENYGLLRAAESAKDVGGTHFIVVANSEASDPSAPRTSGTSQPTGLIRVFRLDPDMTPPMGAISVNEIIHFFGPNFRPAATPG